MGETKRRLYLLLSLLCIALFAGCSSTEENREADRTPAPTATLTPTEAPTATATPTATAVPTPTPFVFLYAEDEELAMAYEKGFVPVKVWETMDEEMSLGTFSSMIRTIVAEADVSVLTELDSYFGAATQISKPADRSLASIAAYYGLWLLGVPENSFFSLLDTQNCWSVSAPDLNTHIGEKVWDEMKALHYTEEYAGAFPRGMEGGYAWDGYWDGDVHVAAYFSMLGHSTIDGRPYFDYDYENDTFHMDYKITCEEGIRAATRFYVLCHEEEYFNDIIRTEIEASTQKQNIEEYSIHALTDRITVGIHFNHASTDWLKNGTGYLGTYNSMYEVLTAESAHIGLDYAKAVLKEYKEKGFHTVQLPLNWTPYYNPETGKIDPWFLDYIEYWVNLILDEGFHCIIGAQRDYGDLTYVGGIPVNNWMEPEYKEAVNAQLTAVWTQVAERFKEYDERVMFKPFVEPQQSIFPELSTGDYDYQAKRMNEVNQVVVDAVRSVGGNSEKRPLILGPLWGQFFMETMIPPKDDYVIAYYHTYFSADGALGFYDLNPEDTIRNEEGLFIRWEKNDPVLNTWVDKTYEQIRVFKETYGIPLIIGEFSPSLTLPEEDRLYVTAYVMQKAHSLGCPIMFWDGYFGDDGKSEVGFYILGRDEWNTEELIEIILKEAETRK